MSNARPFEPDSRGYADTLPSEFMGIGEADSLTDSLSGMPADRAARIAARRAFVEMKQIFIRAVAPLGDRKAAWLRSQVRLANEPIDLWLLRGPVLAALRHEDGCTRTLRADLYRGLDSLFPDANMALAGQDSSGPPSVPPLPEPWVIWAAGEGQNNARR